MITLNLIPRSTPPSALAAQTGVAHGGTVLNIQPATASAAAPSATAVHFPQVLRPALDLASVRAGLRAGVETTVVDLSVAHSFALGNAVVLPIQGTAYYIDKGADVGLATLHIQDQTTSPVNSISTFPGDANNNIPFTFFVIENVAQLGKVLRIHYGTDIMFNPGLGGNTGGLVIAQTQAGAPQNADLAVANRKAYVMRIFDGVAAANFSGVQLYNPAASQKRIYVDALSVQFTGAADMYNISNTQAQLPTNQGALGVNKATYALDGQAQARSDHTGFGVGTITESIGVDVANKVARLVFVTPYILDPSFGMVVQRLTVNSNIQTTFEYREY